MEGDISLSRDLFHTVWNKMTKNVDSNKRGENNISSSFERLQWEGDRLTILDERKEKHSIKLENVSFTHCLNYHS